MRMENACHGMLLHGCKTVVMGWPPLLGSTFIYDGIVARSLTLAMDLDVEGSEMGHCAGSYAGTKRQAKAALFLPQKNFGKLQWRRATGLDGHDFAYFKVCGKKIRCRFNPSRT